MVLVVDDDDAFELLIPRLFDVAKRPLPFRFVYDGEQAIEYLGGTGQFSDRKLYPLPKMILLDLNMPRVNGFEVLKWKRKQPHVAALPVVVWSSSELEQDRTRAIGLGAVDYIVKPVIGQDLIAALELIYRRLTEAQANAGTTD